MIDPNNETAVRALGSRLFAHYLPELAPNAAGRYAAELIDEYSEALSEREVAEREAEARADSLREALAEVIDLAEDAITDDSGDEAETLEAQLADARAEVARLNVALAAIERVARLARGAAGAMIRYYCHDCGETHSLYALKLVRLNPDNETPSTYGNGYAYACPACGSVEGLEVEQ